MHGLQSFRGFRNEDQVMKFLIGLNDQFYVLKTQVLLMDPWPQINKVYSLVVQEENNHRSVSIQEEDTYLFVNPTQRLDSKGKSHHFKGSTRQCIFL